MFNKRKKYLAIFLIKEGNSYSIEGRKLFNPMKNEVSFRKNLFGINISTYTYSKGLTRYYFIDTASKHLLLFEKKSKEIKTDSEILHKIVKGSLIKQLVSDLGNIDYKTIIFNLVIGLIIGGLIGYLVGGM